MRQIIDYFLVVNDFSKNVFLDTDFSKTYPSFLTLKEGSTFLTKPLFPQGREDVTALRCSEPLRSKVGGASKPFAILCGMGPPGNSSLQFIVNFVLIC